MKYKERRKQRLIEKVEKRKPIYEIKEPSKAWVWNAENKQQFLAISEEIFGAYSVVVKKAIAETKRLIAELIDDGKGKYYDYEAAVVVVPYLSNQQQAKSEYPKTDCFLDIEFDYRVWYKEFDLEKDLRFDRTTNWNIEELDVFSDEQYINHYMHGLVCHLKWKIEDILAIDHLWIKTFISFQRKWRKDKIFNFETIYQLKK